MFKLNKWVWLVSCCFILGGCATHLQKNDHVVDVTPVSEIQHSSADANALYQLGRSYQEKEEYAEAISAYEKALEIKPDNYESYNGLGVIYSILGEHELGIQFISEAIRLAPLASHLHNNLGYVYLKQGRASEAAGAFQRALRLDPDNSHARHNLTTAYKRMGCANNEPCGQWQEPSQP